MDHRYCIEYDGINGAEFANTDRLIINGIPYTERGKGEWIVFSGGYICSRCRENGKIKVKNIASHYCPDCGADMRGTNV